MRDFFDFYQLEKKPIVIPHERIRYNEPLPQRVCRFCGKDDNNSFKKKAHTVPQTLGNKFLLSFDECDDCNSLFGEYETHLTNFFEPIRAIFSNGILRKFKSPRERIIVEPFPQIPGGRLISDKSDNYKLTQNQQEIHMKTNSYVPIYVYRALLKIALSLIDKMHIPLYQETYILLTDIDRTNKLNEVAVGVSKYTMQNTIFKKPHFFIFKRKPDINNLPFHVFAMAYFNTFIQFLIPYNEQDSHIYKDGFSIPLCTLDKLYGWNHVKYNKEMVDLSNTINVSHTEKFTVAWQNKNYNESPFKGILENELFANTEFLSKTIIAPFN